MPIAAILGFTAIAFTLVIVPGPDWAYVLAAGTRDHVVLPAVSGLMAGYALITGLVVIGVGPLVAAVPMVLTALTVTGAVYLTYLGFRTLRGGPIGSDEASGKGRHFTRGVGVSALNPKGLLLFLAVLPQFTERGGSWPLPAQFAVLGGIFVLITAVFYVPLGFAADRVLGARPGIAHVATRIAGVAMIVVGSALLVERIVAAA